jgi:hypothetical protein
MTSLRSPLLERIKCNVSHTLGTSPQKNRQLQANPALFHIGSRCYSLIHVVRGQQCVKKVFIRTPDGRRSFANERLARKVFADYKWMTPCVQFGRNWCLQYWLMCPMYPSQTRLDKVAFTLSRPERRRIAGQALAIIHDMYRRGFAHRDFHARNLFYVDGQLKLIDFETITAYLPHQRTQFIQTYDITGRGLESPYLTGHMGYESRIPYSVSSVLGIDTAEAIDSYCNCA